MHRSRDDSRWRFTRHSSPSAFLAEPPQAGAHSITLGPQSLDLLIEDRDSNTTLVVFHSALTNKVASLPVMQGSGIAEAAGVNLVSVSDPSLAMGDVDVAWFIGNRAIGRLRPHLSPVIHHALKTLGGCRTILFGSSGGGYAAVNFAQDFPDCMVLAVNPRLDLKSRPASRMSEYIWACHNARSRTPMLRIRKTFITDNVADTIAGKLPYDMLLFQNTGDTIYLRNQARPFVEIFKDDPRLHVRMEHTGVGHTAIPRTTLRSIIQSLASGADRVDAIRQAGFSQDLVRKGDEMTPTQPHNAPNRVLNSSP